MALPKITLTRTYTMPDGTPAKGSIVIRLVAAMVDVDDNILVPASSIRLPLDNHGAFSTALVPSDAAGLAPTPVPYEITEKIGSKAVQYAVTILGDDGDTIELSSIAPIGDPPDPPSAYVLNTELAAETTARTVAITAEATTRATADSANAAAITAEAATARAAETLKVAKAGDTMTGPLTLPGDPTAAGHAARKAYVDTAVANLVNAAPSTLDTLGEIATQLASDESAATALVTTVAGKLAKASNLSDVSDAGTSRANLHIAELLPAQCLATSNQALSGKPTIDGYATQNSDVVLLVGQTTGSQNGPWQIPATGSGAWARPTDFPAAAVVKARSCKVAGGTVYGGSDWVLMTTSTVTVDATTQTWKQVGSGAYLPVSLAPTNDALAGSPCYIYGNSYGVEPRSFVIERYYERLVRRLRSRSTFNGALYGAMTHDMVTMMMSNTPKTIAGVLDAAMASAAATFQVSPSNFGAVILETVRNDAGFDAQYSSTKARAGFQNGLLAAIRLVQAQSFKAYNDASIVYGGTGWAAAGGSLYRSGTIKGTTHPGDTATFTLPVGTTDIDLVLFAWDSASGANGAPFTTTLNGVAGPSGTTNDAYTCQIQSTTNFGAQYVVGFHGMPATGTNVIVLTHAGTGSTQNLDVDGYLVKSASPMQVVIPKAAKLNATGYTAYAAGSGSWATDQIYNAIIDTVCAMFSDGSVVAFDPNAAGWDNTLHLRSDGVHPNDLGTLVYADGLMALLNSLPARLGFTTSAAT